MAKQTTRRQRRTFPEPAQPRGPAAEPPAPVWLTRAFWTGGGVIGGLVALGAVVVVIVTGGDDAPATSAGPTPTAVSEGVQSTEELEQQFAERDREQIEAMTADAKRVVEEFSPTITAFNRALRARKTAPPVSAQWLDRARRYAAQYAQSESGATGTNVAGGALRASLEGFVNAIELHRAASDAPNRAALIARARAQRDIAIRTWSTATIQIDAINIGAGFGHQHVPSLGGKGVGDGAHDSLPEGTGATDDG